MQIFISQPDNFGVLRLGVCGDFEVVQERRAKLSKGRSGSPGQKKSLVPFKCLENVNIDIGNHTDVRTQSKGVIFSTNSRYLT